jgi:cell division protein FtsB
MGSRHLTSIIKNKKTVNTTKERKKKEGRRWLPRMVFAVLSVSSTLCSPLFNLLMLAANCANDAADKLRRTEKEKRKGTSNKLNIDRERVMKEIEIERDLDCSMHSHR